MGEQSQLSTELKKAEGDIKFRLELEKTISSISSRFVGISDIDDAITATLEDIGKLSGASRAYLFLFNEDGITMDNTHEWCDEGVSPQIDTLKNLPKDTFPWWMKKLQDNETIHITDISKLPVEANAEKEILESQDIKSLLVLPLYMGRELKGFIGFDNVIKTGNWADNDITLLRISSEILENALERKKAEEETIRTKEYLQNIINSASEIIIAFDKNNRVTTWNKTAELITGYKTRDIIGRPITKLTVFDKPQELLDAIKSIYNGHKRVIDEFILRTKHGTKRIIHPSYSTIKGGNEGSVGVVFVGKDITHERESHRKLLKGNSYLISDKNNKAAVDLFIDLTRLDYKGLFITRASPEMIKGLTLSSNMQVILLSQEKLGRFENISNLGDLAAKIKEFSLKNTNALILLDRIDYLLTCFSFEKFVKALYQISNIVSKNKSILLVHLVPSLLDIRQKTVIEGELQTLPSQKIDNIQIEDEFYDILKFVHEENQLNSLVSFKKISREFSIDKSTTAKRVRMLESKGLVSIKKQGRSKTVHILEKGNTLLHKRQIA